MTMFEIADDSDLAALAAATADELDELPDEDARHRWYEENLADVHVVIAVWFEDDPAHFRRAVVKGADLVRDAAASRTPVKMLVIPVESTRDVEILRARCDPSTCCTYCRARKGVDDLSGPPICPECLVAFPGPQMLLVSFGNSVLDFETITNVALERAMQIQVLHGGDPTGWQVKPLTRADEKLFAPQLRKMTEELQGRGST